MDVTPQLIEQIDFAERRFGGYDPDQVDDFLERVGATISRLQDELRSALRRAERSEQALADAQRALAEQPAVPAEEAAVAELVDDSDIEQATSTLLLAKRTAEAAISEARAEASKLLSEARTRSEAETRDAAAEADRLLRDAQLQRDDLLKRAREDADAEYADQREQFRREIAELDSTKLRLVEDVRLLEGRLAEYRAGLVEVHGAIGALLDDPESLRTRAPLEIDMTPSSTTQATPFYTTSSTPVVTLPEARAEAVDADDVTVVSDGGTRGGDPWGPGSWSEVSAAFEEAPTDQPTVLVDDVFEPATPDSPALESVEVTGDQGDRYLQELHEAVNAEDTGDDPAMEEFFEGADERPKRRRGRR